MMKSKLTLSGAAGNNGSYKWLALALVRALLVILCVMTAVFFLIRIVPGDPAKMILGEYSTPEALKNMHHTLGLDLSLWDQFTRFVKLLFTQGDTGNSIIAGTSTRELIAERAPVTLLLIVIASVLAIIIALLLATVAATHKDKLLDHLIRIIPAVTLGMPVFWVGILFILFFSVRLGWFPVGESAKAGRVRSIVWCFRRSRLLFHRFLRWSARCVHKCWRYWNPNSLLLSVQLEFRPG